MSVVHFYRPRARARILRGEHVPYVHDHKTASKRIAAYILSYPFWVDYQAIKELKRRADDMTRLTGVKHVLDHIIPVNHPRVCGLSVPSNLQVITEKANGRKSNHWVEWHGELFSEPEQLALF